MTPEGNTAHAGSNTDSDHDSFLDTLRKRPHTRPGKRAWYPRIKREDAQECLAFLGHEWEAFATEYEHNLREYRTDSLINSGGPGAAGAMFFFGFFATFVLPGDPGSPWTNGFLLAALYAAARGLVSVTPYGARIKFFRRAFFVDLRTREFERAEINEVFVGCMNEAGRGARSLFRYIQGGRLTWTSPPIVADRALMLTYPIINLDLHAESYELTVDQFLVAYSRFFRDVAVLVALEREDLIPELRTKYPVLPAVAASMPSEVPERDARFLDPMRDHSRWQVFKDYLLPLASWFSLALAIAALVINKAG